MLILYNVINIFLVHNFKNMIYSEEDNLKVISFFELSNPLPPRYRSIGCCKSIHWRKSCVTRREDLTTLVYIVLRKREGGLRSNFFYFPLFRATPFVIRDAISFASPLPPHTILSGGQLRMQRGQEVTIG